MRIARDFGTVSELLPPGVKNIRDIPHPLFDAVRMALVFISFDELPKEERPPRKIWLDQEALGAWFERIDRERERKYGDKSKGEDTLMEGDSVENKAARGLLAGG